MTITLHDNLVQGSDEWLAAMLVIKAKQLLRQYSGPMDRLGAGDFELADKTYDGCVKKTMNALRSTNNV